MKYLVCSSLLLILFLGSNCFSADIARGKAKAAVCAACHGHDGISYVPLYPNLKGQKAAYTEKQLKDFKSKKRQDPVMNAQAAMLSDEDIANIAAYYESLGVSKK